MKEILKKSRSERRQKLRQLVEQKQKQRKSLTETYPTNSYIRIIEPLNKDVYSSKDVRLKILKQSLQVDESLEGIAVLVDYENVIDLILDHTGHEDVPINTLDKTGDDNGLLLNINDIIGYLDSGQEVYQYIIRYTPPWIRNRRKSGSYDIPEGWIRADRVAEIKDSTVRTVDEYCRKNNLRCRRFAEGDYYVYPDLKLDYWIKTIPDYGALYRRLQIIKDAIDVLPEPSIDLMFEIAENLENESEAEPKGAKGKIKFKKFVEKSLGSFLPRTIDEWIDKIDDLILIVGIKREEIYNT